MATLGIQFQVGSGVTPTDIDQIETGLEIAQSYLDQFLGGGISAGTRSLMTVKIEATGLGNQEDGGGGGVATAFSTSTTLPRPYFDVAHVQWSQNTTGRGWTVAADNMKTVVHEYVHGWQGTLGAISIYSQPLGNWLNEGIAEFLAYEAMVWAGHMTNADADLFVFNGAVSSNEFGDALSNFQTTQTPLWVGHVGYVAIDWLVAESVHGLLSLRILATEIAEGASVAVAFKAAFNIELSSFYAQFEAWRAEIIADPVSAYNNRPVLITLGDGTEADDTLVGTTADDIINGLGGNDVISGLEGNDTMDGGPGNDTFVVDSAGDVVIEAVGQGVLDFVIARTHYTLAVGAEVEKLATNSVAGTATIYLTGNEFAQTISGNNGLNRLDGGGGVDYLAGFAGDDTYIVDVIGDIVVDGTNQGAADTVRTLGGYALGASAQIEQFWAFDAYSTLNFNMFGNDFAQEMRGNNGANRMFGGGKADVIKGFAGNDTFVFTNVTQSGVGFLNRDIIQDFEDYSDNDRIDLSGFAGTLSYMGSGAFTGLNQVRAVQHGSHILIQINSFGSTAADAEILLANTPILRLDATDFLL